MKVLFVHDTIDCRGGAENFVRDQIELYKNNDIKIYTFFVGREDIDITTSSSYYKEFSNFLPRWMAKIFIDPLLIWKLKRFISQIQPDIIHLHHTYNYPLSFYLGLPRTIPIIKSVYDYGLVCASSWGVNKQTGEDCNCGYSLRSIRSDCMSLTRYLIFFLKHKALFWLSRNFPDRILVADKHMADLLRNAGFKRITVLPYFTNPPHRINPNKKSPKVPHILFIGKLTPEKGVSDLLKAVALIKDTDQPFCLDIVGDGPEKQALVNEVHSLKINKITHFHGSVARQHLANFYQQSLILIIPSLWKQNLPLVMMDAMIVGLPVISSATGSAPYIIRSGQNGFLYTKGDFRKLSKQILFCILEKGKIVAMQKKAREYAEQNFSSMIYIKKISQIYDNIIHP